MKKIDLFSIKLRLIAKFKISVRKVIRKIELFESQYLSFNLIHIYSISIFLLFYFWFQVPIKKLFEKFIIVYLGNHFPSDSLGIWLGTFYLVIVLTTALHFFKKFHPRNYKPTLLLISALFFSSLQYGYERIIHKAYIFLLVFNNNDKLNLAILDPIFLIMFLFSISFLRYAYDFTKLNDSASFINQDQAIENKRFDEYERKAFVEDISRSIDNIRLNSIQSFVIGINSSWGNGKTSVLNLLSKELNQETIKIKFNPWISNKNHNLIRDFFDTIEEEISKHISTSNLFKKYGKNLTKIDAEENPLKPFSFFFEDKTLQKRFDELSTLIKKTHKRVYVFIDDIDRLNKEEVFEILRLIRSSACFPNMMFIIAYDRYYIEKALETKGIPDSNKYLEKIIQLEIKLPVISEFAIKNIFVTELKKQIKLINFPIDYEFEAIRMVEDLILDSNHVKKNDKYLVGKWIVNIFRNKRDIIRFSNSFSLRLSHSYNKIYLPDLFILELIKFYVPDVFSKISVVGNNYSISKLYNTTMRILSLEKTDSMFSDPQLLNYLEKEYVSDPRQSLIIDLINRLISQPEFTDPFSEFGIFFEDYYNSYFTLTIPNNLVTTSAIQTLISA